MACVVVILLPQGPSHPCRDGARRVFADQADIGWGGRKLLCCLLAMALLILTDAAATAVAAAAAACWEGY